MGSYGENRVRFWLREFLAAPVPVLRFLVTNVSVDFTTKFYLVPCDNNAGWVKVSELFRGVCYALLV